MANIRVVPLGKANIYKLYSYVLYTVGAGQGEQWMCHLCIYSMVYAVLVLIYSACIQQSLYYKSLMSHILF